MFVAKTQSTVNRVTHTCSTVECCCTHNLASALSSIYSHPQLCHSKNVRRSGAVTHVFICPTKSSGSFVSAAEKHNLIWTRYMNKRENTLESCALQQQSSLACKSNSVTYTKTSRVNECVIKRERERTLNSQWRRIGLAAAPPACGPLWCSRALHPEKEF